MARTDRVGEIAGGAPRSSGRGRTGASTTGVGKPKVKAPSAKAKKIAKLPEQRAVRMLETGQSAKNWKPETASKKRFEKINDEGRSKNVSIRDRMEKTSNKSLSKMVNAKNTKQTARTVDKKRKVANQNLNKWAEQTTEKNIKKDYFSGDKRTVRESGMRKSIGATPKIPVKKKGK